MNAADHMDFSDRLVKSGPNLLLDLRHTHLIGELGALFFAKGAKLAQIGADIGVIDMLIVDEKGAGTIVPLPHDIGEIADGENIC